MTKEARFTHSDDGINNNGVHGNIDVAFKKINKNFTDFLIWRIETVNLVALTKDQYGTFYDTESYIVYAASQYGQPSGIDSVTRDVKGKTMEYHIHFWLGANTTPEKSGIAAYKTVELDCMLGLCTTQHREAQESESCRFLSYFKNGFRILKPALISNEEKLYPKLYKIKGKSVPALIEMSNLAWENFRSSEIFLIRTPTTVFVWIGRATSMEERRHSIKMSQDLKDQFKIPNIVFVDDGYEKTMEKESQKLFSKYLPLEKRLVLPENQENSCRSISTKYNVRLYKCSENNGKYRVAEVKCGPLYSTDFNSEDVFIIDQDIYGIWVWVGKRVEEKEKTEALRNARGFVKKKKYPSSTKVTRVVEGLEPIEFKVLFKQWKTECTKNKSQKSNTLLSKFDAVTMEERRTLAAETQLIDDGSGGMTLWRIKNNKIVEIPQERHGCFFSGDCYIALYSYQVGNVEKHLLYYWIGSNANQDEINITITKLGEIDEELGELGFQARIIQGRETAHFLQLFKGKLTIFKGRGIDFDETGKNMKNSNQYLLKIYGSSTYSTKAIQVDMKASSLDSNFCFVLRRGKKYYLWCGNYSTGDQREVAKGFAGKDCELLLEGKERDEFFGYLGGHSPYQMQMIRNDIDPKPSRLFYCNPFKKFEVHEILFFQQKDLLPENLALLDTNDTIYVWIGKLSSREEQRLSTQTALQYLQADPSERDMNMPIIHVKQDREPPTFTGFFPSWDVRFWKHYKVFGKLRQEIEMDNIDQTFQIGNRSQNSSDNGDFDHYEKYPINVLKEPNERLPPKVNSLNKELHLTHDDFVSVFQMSYKEFEKLPKWKQQELKKKVGLF